MNRQHQELTPTWTTDFGWLCYVNVGSSVIQMYHSGGWDIDHGGDYELGW